MLAWVPSFPEMIIIGVIALLLFGRRLPEVGRSLGKGIVEFKKGLREVENEVANSTMQPPSPPAPPPAHTQPTPPTTPPNTTTQN